VPAEAVVQEDSQGRPRQITFRWPELVSRHGGKLPIAFAMTVALGEDGFTYGGHVENRSQHVVESVSLPLIGDLSRPVGCAALRRMSMGYAGMDEGELFPRFACNRGYWGIDYPTQMVATPTTPFVLIDAAGQGLYVGYHDTTARQMVQFAFEQRPGYAQTSGFAPAAVPVEDEIGGQTVHLSLSVHHYPFAAPGESAEVGPVVLAPYVGGWHAGADHYKRWRATWFRRPPCPAWAREVHSWQQVHINSPEDELRCRYRDLVKYGRSCAAHGVAAIQLVGWNHGGQDRGNPSHDTDPRLGTAAELREAIAEIQKLGVKVVLFNKFTWADRSTARFRDELIRWATKDPYGDYHMHGGYGYQTPTQLADINTRRLVPMCHLAAGWREIACREFRKGIDLGADGMLYDESQHHHPATYCFDAGHGHRVPSHVFAGDAALAEEFRRVAGAARPDYLFAGEGCYDLELRHYSVSYTRIRRDHVPVERYVDSDAGVMIAVYGYNDRTTINQALLFKYIISYEPRNFKGRLEEFPLTVAYGRQVDALRRRYAEFLWHGEFRDTLGARVEAAGGEVRHTVFVSRGSGARAVVVANQSATEGAEVRVAIDPPRRDLTAASPEAPEGRPNDGSVGIPPMSAVVVMEGR